jgi:hypothetical protein
MAIAWLATGTCVATIPIKSGERPPVGKNNWLVRKRKHGPGGDPKGSPPDTGYGYNKPRVSGVFFGS